MLEPLPDLPVWTKDDGPGGDHLHLFRICICCEKIQSESELFGIGEHLREDMFAFVGTFELGILSQEVEFLFGEQFFSLLFILDEMEAIGLDLYASIVTFFSLVLRYVLSR